MHNFLPNFSFLSIDSTATNLLICPDQYVATYSPNNTTGHVSTRTYINIDYGYDAGGVAVCFNPKPNTIAVILESPHSDEYEYINGILTPKGPLVGSWTDFEQFFHGAIQASRLSSYISSSSVYNIAFVNAVQYQCSLGKVLYRNKINSAQKDRNVINSWYSGLSNDLEKRLIALNPCMIIDLSGKTQKIHEAIVAMIHTSKLNTCLFVSGMHPSRWKQQTALARQLIQ